MFKVDLQKNNFHTHTLTAFLPFHSLHLFLEPLTGLLEAGQFDHHLVQLTLIVSEVAGNFLATVGGRDEGRVMVEGQRPGRFSQLFTTKPNLKNKFRSNYKIGPIHPIHNK